MQYPVANSSALVVGSITPWVETLLLMAGAAVPITTVDFNPPVSKVKEIRTMSVQQLERETLPRLSPMLSPASHSGRDKGGADGGGNGNEGRTWDVVVSYSSLEHDGLGRLARVGAAVRS